jgi:hypothetical protein
MAVDSKDQHLDEGELGNALVTESTSPKSGGDDVIPIASRVPGLSACLQSFYSREQPAKTKAVEAILKVYNMREHSLLLEVATKYGHVVDGDPNRLPGRGVRFGLPMAADEVVVEVYGARASPSPVADSDPAQVVVDTKAEHGETSGEGAVIKLKTFVVDCRTDEQVARTGTC